MEKRKKSETYQQQIIAYGRETGEPVMWFEYVFDDKETGRQLADEFTKVIEKSLGDTLGNISFSDVEKTDIEDIKRDKT